MEILSKRINEIVQEYKAHGHFGIAIEWKEKCFYFNAKDVFPSASLIKLPILLEGFMQSSSGTLVLDDLERVKDIQKVGGAGIVQYMSP